MKYAYCSIVKGRGYLNHNDRTIKQVNSRSWKPELSSQNIVYVNEPIQKCISRAVRFSFRKLQSNANQKRIIQNVKSKTTTNISADPNRRNRSTNISLHLVILTIKTQRFIQFFNNVWTNTIEIFNLETLISV